MSVTARQATSTPAERWSLLFLATQMSVSRLRNRETKDWITLKVKKEEPTIMFFMIMLLYLLLVLALWGRV